jgi:hypothetical protein
MGILDTVKGLFGSKVNDMVNSATSQVTSAVSSAASNLVNFDDINVEKFMGYVNKFGLMGKIKEMSPSIAAKLEDGTISDEDVKSFIPEIKGLIMSKLGMGGAESAVSEDTVKADCVNCEGGVCKCD